MAQPTLGNFIGGILQEISQTPISPRQSSEFKQEFVAMSPGENKPRIVGYGESPEGDSALSIETGMGLDACISNECRFTICKMTYHEQYCK